MTLLYSAAVRPKPDGEVARPELPLFSITDHRLQRCSKVHPRCSQSRDSLPWTVVHEHV
jgi:hypothetical protein